MADGIQAFQYHRFWGLQKQASSNASNRLFMAYQSADWDSLIEQQRRFDQQTRLRRFVCWLFNWEDYALNSYLLLFHFVEERQKMEDWLGYAGLMRAYRRVIRLQSIDENIAFFYAPVIPGVVRGGMLKDLALLDVDRKVGDTITEEELRKAYLAANLVYHPDKNPDIPDTRFKELKPAWKRLHLQLGYDEDCEDPLIQNFSRFLDRYIPMIEQMIRDINSIRASGALHGDMLNEIKEACQKTIQGVAEVIRMGDDLPDRFTRKTQEKFEKLQGLFAELNHMAEWMDEPVNQNWNEARSKQPDLNKQVCLFFSNASGSKQEDAEQACCRV